MPSWIEVTAQASAVRNSIVSGEGWSEDIWAKFAELGITGLALPADSGGFGGILMNALALTVFPLEPAWICNKASDAATACIDCRGRPHGRARP